MRYLVAACPFGKYTVVADDVSNYYDALQIAENYKGYAIIALVVNMRNSFDGTWSDPGHKEEYSR